MSEPAVRKYLVYVRWEMSKALEVDALNEDDAIAAVNQMWHSGDVEAEGEDVNFETFTVDMIEEAEAEDGMNGGIAVDLYTRALAAAGYDDSDPTEEAVRECFSDYVDSGYWQDMTQEDTEGLTVTQMARALIQGN